MDREAQHVADLDGGVTAVDHPAVQPQTTRFRDGLCDGPGLRDPREPQELVEPEPLRRFVSHD
jgi:hypothetical protein